jgi:hypothetical protein
VIREKGDWLPNMLHRYCTHYMKLAPIFYWWWELISEPVEMRIGFRANEVGRANKTLAKTNADGLLEFKGTNDKWIGGRHDGLNKWEMVPWQKPRFPLIEDNIYKDDIHEFWKDKPVRFADYNNCVGCFHRNPQFLKFMFQRHPSKMQWFKKQEEGRRLGTWKSDITYAAVEKMKLQISLFAEDFGGCDDGFCEIN